MLDAQAYRAIGSSLSGITSQQTMTGAFTTGSFSYTTDQLRDLVNEWKTLADDYQQSLAIGVPLVQVEGPGDEYVSRSHANTANYSGRAYMDSLQEKYKYCVAQAQKMQDTLDDYLGLEHHNVNSINRPGTQDGI